MTLTSRAIVARESGGRNDRHRHAGRPTMRRRRRCSSSAVVSGWQLRAADVGAKRGTVAAVACGHQRDAAEHEADRELLLPRRPLAYPRASPPLSAAVHLNVRNDSCQNSTVDKGVFVEYALSAFSGDGHFMTLWPMATLAQQRDGQQQRRPDVAHVDGVHDGDAGQLERHHEEVVREHRAWV